EGNKSVLGGVPRSLPAMVKAYRIQDKVRGVGFDWDTSEQVWAKVEEELSEFKEAEAFHRSSETLAGTDVEAEFGDLLFSLINYARHIGINPENALERTNKKFINRFNHLEEAVKTSGKNLKDLSLSELDLYW